MQEKKAFHVNGYLGLIAAIAVAVLGVWLCYRGYADQQHGELAVGVVLILLAALCASALTIVQPNEAKVLTFFWQLYWHDSRCRPVYDGAVNGQAEHFLTSTQF